MSLTFNILVINPGSTNTKIAWYKNRSVDKDHSSFSGGIV